MNGKQFIVGSHVTLADVFVGSIFTPAFQLALDAGFRKGMSNVGSWFERFVALPEVIKAAGNITPCAKALKPAGDNKGGKAAAPAKETKKSNDDDLDLFGDDNEEEAAAAKAAAVAAKGAKKPKKVVIAQSLVLFEVKPVDSDTNLDDLAAKIL